MNRSSSSSCSSSSLKGAIGSTTRTRTRTILTCAGLVALLLAMPDGKAETTNSLSDAQIQGRQLAQQLLEQQPVTNFVQTGVLKIKKQGVGWTEHQIKFQINITPTNWETMYCSDYPTNRDILLTKSSATVLEITHSGNLPNEYLYNDASCLPVVIRGNETMLPFAGSDFWVADLGLEFFHWPAQKVLKKEVKRSRGCTVLESTNPNPAPNSYSRVVCWIDNETLGIVQAQAFDAKGKLLKEFAPKNLKKVKGQWQVESMVMDNVQTGSRTRLEFDLKTP